MPLPEEGSNFSFADYLTWPEDERWEIFDGVPYMQSAPTSDHQAIISNLNTAFGTYLKGTICKLYPGPFCVRFAEGINTKNDEIRNVAEPDISVVCDKAKIDKQGCNGSPDLIVEVLSPSTSKLDRFIKLNLYEKNGVREYWIVEPKDRIITVYILESTHKYGFRVYDDESSIPVSIFDKLTISAKEVFDY